MPASSAAQPPRPRSAHRPPRAKTPPMASFRLLRQPRRAETPPVWSFGPVPGAAREVSRGHMSDAIVWLTIFVLAVFVGVEVISKVSSTLHTPLMSGANAIHGVILVGAILVAGTARSTPILTLA